MLLSFLPTFFSCAKLCQKQDYDGIFGANPILSTKTFQKFVPDMFSVGFMGKKNMKHFFPYNNYLSSYRLVYILFCRLGYFSIISIIIGLVVFIEVLVYNFVVVK